MHIYLGDHAYACDRLSAIDRIHQLSFPLLVCAAVWSSGVVLYSMLFGSGPVCHNLMKFWQGPLDIACWAYLEMLHLNSCTQCT